MASQRRRAALRQTRMLLDFGTVGHLTDRQLLERFRTYEGDAAEMAFSALVDRHGPMVLRVCRRTLRDPNDVLDAFQATFLVLVRKAGILWSHDSLGPWLHAVACRVSAYSRGADARRKTHERAAAEQSPRSVEPPTWDDLAVVVHEEINRLPETLRAAVVLCDLEGLTQEQAARHLGWPAGTVRSRLARGRSRLLSRLTRRGLAPSAGALFALLSSEASTAAVPVTIASAAVRSALLVAAAPGKAGTVAASAAILTEGVMRAMFMTKLKAVTAAALLLTASAGGAVVVAFAQTEDPRAAPSGSTTAQVLKPDASDAGGKNALAPSDPFAPPVEAPNTAGDELALARSKLKRAEDRLEWADKMFAQKYVSENQVLSERLALRQARFELENAQARMAAFERYRLSLTPTSLAPAAEKKIALDVRELAIFDQEVALAETRLEVAEIKLAQTENLVAKGMASKSVAGEEKIAVMQAKLELDKTRFRRDGILGNSPEEPASNEGARAQAELAEVVKGIQSTQQKREKIQEKIDASRWKELAGRRVNRERPGSYSERYLQAAKADAQEAEAEFNLNKAELQLIELQLKQADAAGRDARVPSDSDLLNARLEIARAGYRLEGSRLERIKDEATRLDRVKNSAAKTYEARRAEIEDLEKQLKARKD